MAVLRHIPQTLGHPVKLTPTMSALLRQWSQPPPAAAGQKSGEAAMETGMAIETPPLVPPEPEAYWEGQSTVQALEETLK